MPGADVEVDEIDHAAGEEAVDQIADGAANDQGQGSGGDAFMLGQAHQPDDQGDGHDQGEGGEEPALPAAGIGEEAEGGTLVVHEGEVKQWRDGDGPEGLQQGLRQPLGGLVQDHHQQREPEPAGHGGIRDQLHATLFPHIRPPALG